MTIKDTGGPAFPVNDTDVELLHLGMTLLDWFAGQALAGMAEGYDPSESKILAETSYDYAEAMLVEKRKREAKK